MMGPVFVSLSLRRSINPDRHRLPQTSPRGSYFRSPKYNEVILQRRVKIAILMEKKLQWQLTKNENDFDNRNRSIVKSGNRLTH